MFGTFSMFSYDDDDKYYAKAKEDVKKKKLTFANIFRWTVYAVVILMLAVVFSRLMILKDPKDINVILTDEKISAEIANLGNNFIVYKISAPNPFVFGDVFYINNIVYLESSENLQITLRCKKNRFENLLKDLQTDGYKSYSGLLAFYLKVSTKSEAADEIDEIDEVDETDKTDAPDKSKNPDESKNADYTADAIDISHQYNFETENYEYIRLSFDGVKINYAKSKVELYVWPEYTTEYNDGEFIARIIIFDIITPKEKVKIKNFEQKKY